MQHPKHPSIGQPLLVIFFLSALTAVLISGCRSSEETPAVVRPVAVLPVATADAVERVELIGMLESDSEIRVYAEIPERIQRLNVREGDRVKRGDVLISLSGDMQNEAHRQAQAVLDTALTGRDTARENQRRVGALAERGGVSAAQAEAAEHQLRSAEAQVKQARAALAQAATQRARTQITAPIDGVVTGLRVREGDLVAPGAPLLSVVDDQKLKAVLWAPERTFMRIRAGMPAELALVADERHGALGTVSLRGASIDAVSRAGLVEVAVDNADGDLLPGAAVRVGIELARRENAVQVPGAAVLFTADTAQDGSARVFVVDNELAHERRVQLGLRQSGAWEIVSGLEAGETLVTDGAHLLRDGQAVRVIHAAQEER